MALKVAMSVPHAMQCLKCESTTAKFLHFFLATDWTPTKPEGPVDLREYDDIVKNTQLPTSSSLSDIFHPMEPGRDRRVDDPQAGVSSGYVGPAHSQGGGESGRVRVGWTIPPQALDPSRRMAHC